MFSYVFLEQTTPCLREDNDPRASPQIRVSQVLSRPVRYRLIECLINFRALLVALLQSSPQPVEGQRTDSTI